MVETSDGGPRIRVHEERVDLSNNALIEFLQQRRNHIKKDLNWGTGGKMAYDRGMGKQQMQGNSNCFLESSKLSQCFCTKLAL